MQVFSALGLLITLWWLLVPLPPAGEEFFIFLGFGAIMGLAGFIGALRVRNMAFNGVAFPALFCLGWAAQWAKVAGAHGYPFWDASLVIPLVLGVAVSAALVVTDMLVRLMRRQRA
jgi:hypothetical protein